MDDPTKQLVDELCSLLDETTILSITSDYNLNDPAQFAEARAILQAISKDVVAEEATGFNPSGIGVNHDIEINPSEQDAAEPIPALDSDLKSSDGVTTTTDSSRSKSQVSVASSATSKPGSPGYHVPMLDGLTNQEKEQQLAEMFVSLKSLDIKSALKKARGNADVAIDELFNLQYLEDTGQRPKGIDGFYVSDDDVTIAAVTQKKRKGKKKKIKGSPKLSSASSPLSATSVESPTRDESKDEANVAFLTDKFSLPESDASCMYQSKGYCLGAAIVAYLDNYLALDIPTLSASEHMLDAQAKRIPWIPEIYFGPIFETTSSHQAAVEVVDVLAQHFEKPAYLKYDISYSLAATGSDSVIADPNPALTRPPSKSSTSTTPITRSPLPLPATAYKQPPLSLDTRAASLDHLTSSVAGANRKGRSDPHFRHVAAFYAERRRDEVAGLVQARSAEAYQRVDATSTFDSVDLHGATVQVGVDIALDRVRAWWDGLLLGSTSEERKRRARENGFTVITGIGRHSADGRSPLRSSVGKALTAHGWKAEVLTGKFLVVGRR
ncbi:hypothetical protein F5Y15DRAFT_167034 [Xylariaceae sp. FL0016]|nr:hypothetical protein F5Y15DRAFT_167034 [Xylariaceae sp. FL0016]